MGCCVSNANKNYHRLQIRNSKLDENAKILIIENFKIVDYTLSLENLNDLKLLKNASTFNCYFPNFFPVEIRCMKIKKERRSDHSHLFIVFNQYNEEGTVEIGFTTDYSPYGFAITIAGFEIINEIYGMSGYRLEFLYLPKVGNQKNLTIGEVIEWAYLHKDEQYRSPKSSPELNMGYRIFQYAKQKLSEDQI
jgi:hypothetical protein